MRYRVRNSQSIKIYLKIIVKQEKIFLLKIQKLTNSKNK